jgi:hypothetical protein
MNQPKIVILKMLACEAVWIVFNKVRVLTILIVLIFSPIHYSHAQQQVLDNTFYHLRNAETREWSEFSIQAEKQLLLHFQSQINVSEQTLSLRQYDVKQDWHVLINDHEIGILVVDEKDISGYYTIPAGTFRAGENTLQIKSAATDPDDIRVGEIMVDMRPLQEVLSEASIDITVIENGMNILLPARITILNEKRSLQTVSARPEQNLSIRPGYVYTGNGKASLRLPAGKYTIYAGRGFEYGIDSMNVELKVGDRVEKLFGIKREVETTGWISSDTHIHTFTYSRHGDATTEERALTIAGEGIELPIMTDHNLYVDLTPAAKTSGVLRWFTLVTGDEVTTKVGHFNVFKTIVGTRVIDYQVEDWNGLSQNMSDVGNNNAIILNHARDIHNGFRPFDPSRHLSSAGTDKDDWKFPANAMEVINSGSQQTDIMQLYRDWFGMLNRGYFLTPVGCSDSHDVSRFTVGQGRTYIQSNDSDPGNIDVEKAIKNFREGRVMVSLGLLTKILVNNIYGPGDIVPASRKVNIAVEVSGSSWTNAERIVLYANGKKIQEKKIDQTEGVPVKWKTSWTIPVPRHDIFLVAIAEGSGEGMPWWPIAKPYQPSSPDWHPRVIGSTGAVWIDADKNGKRNSAYDYAKEILSSSKGEINQIVKSLTPYDEAVAIQLFTLLWKNGKDLTSIEFSQAIKRAAPATKAGFDIIVLETQQIKK